MLSELIFHTQKHGRTAQYSFAFGDYRIILHNTRTVPSMTISLNGTAVSQIRGVIPVFLDWTASLREYASTHAEILHPSALPSFID